MCKAFSCIITEKGKVYWKVGLDSHDDIINLFIKEDKDLIDDKQPPYNTFARVEITPVDGNYFNNKQKWVYKIDENILPKFIDSSHEFICREALQKWQTEIYSLINLDKAQNIIHPFKIAPPKLTNKQLLLLKQWASVWDSVGASVRASVGASVWDSVGDSVWASVRASVRDSVWASVRDSVWASVRDSVGASVGDSVWDSVWDSVGDSVWAYIGNIFKLQEWKYIDYNNSLFQKGIYPFNSLIQLWEQGLVPSFDGKLWRLHGGKNAKILWEDKVKEDK